VNRINPLHIIALLSVIILFVFFQLSKIKEDIHEEQAAYNKSKKVALELYAYKKLYKRETDASKSLMQILAQPSLKEAQLKIYKTTKSIRVESKAITLSQLNFLLSKVLNGAYVIKKLEVKDKSASDFSLKLEIQW
jgi:hypothetical protein